MAAVLVHIDLEARQPHPSSLVALATGRLVASSWGATLYAVLIVHEPGDQSAPDSTAHVVTTSRVPGIELIQNALARGGADKVVVAMTDTAIEPLWGAVGPAWQGVLDHLRPRLVLFGADAPSALELGPRTAARIGARLLHRARGTGIDDFELRDRDGGYVRASDGGAAVAMIGTAVPIASADADDIDVVVLMLPGKDDRVELVGANPAELVHATGVVIVLGDDILADAAAVTAAKLLATRLDARLAGSPAAVRSGAIDAASVVERTTALAPELCILVGNALVDLAGCTSVIRIGSTNGKGVDGALPAPVATSITELVAALEVP